MGEKKSHKANKLEMEYAQSLSLPDAIQQVQDLLGSLSQGSLPVGQQEPIKVSVPGKVDMRFKLKEKPEKGGKLSLKLMWDEVPPRARGNGFGEMQQQQQPQAQPQQQPAYAQAGSRPPQAPAEQRQPSAAARSGASEGN